MITRILAIVAASCLLISVGGTVSTAEAGWKGKGKYSKYSKSKRRYRRRGKRARVRGFVRRRGGGYSYSANDVVNTYGDSRTRYGSVNSYRDPFSDRQTNFGPFDHGFFYDSAVAPRGGDSPYLQ